MRHRALAAMLVAVMTPIAPPAVHAQPAPPELAAGIRQAQSGDFDAAVITLEAVVARTSPGLTPKDRGRALLYLAVAYHGLAQNEKAKQRLLQALQADPALTLDPKEFPPVIMDFFADTLKGAGRPMPAPPPTAAERKGGGGKTLLIVAGLGAAAAGVAVAAGGGGSSTPTTTLPPIPSVAGTWVGDGANGQFFTAGPCVGQLDVTMRITQSGGTLTGTATFRVARQGGPAGCPSGDVGREANGNLAGSVAANNDVRFTFPGLNGETWQGTVQGNRMQGNVTGISADVQSTWSVVRQ
jgi:hypothetical protein